MAKPRAAWQEARLRGSLIPLLLCLNVVTPPLAWLSNAARACLRMLRCKSESSRSLRWVSHNHTIRAGSLQSKWTACALGFPHPQIAQGSISSLPSIIHLSVCFRHHSLSNSVVTISALAQGLLSYPPEAFSRSQEPIMHLHPENGTQNSLKA
jgi:hypothetical protein